MTTRRSTVLLLSLLMFMVFPIIAQAEVTHINMGEADGVSVDKEWEIQFNEGVEIIEESLSDVNIVVKDSYGQTVNVPDAYVKGENTIVVPAPEEGYRGGEQYKLYVGKTIQFASGMKMQDRYMKTFSTERDVLAPNPGGDIVSYGTVTSDTLNIRKQPTSGSEKVGVLTEGDRVNIYNFDGYWAEIQHNGQKAYVHKTYMKLRSTTGGVLQDQIIVLDPGHGGGDPGAVANGGQEKEIVLDVSKRVYDLLKQKGAQPLMTRDDDTYQTLGGRVQYADDNNNDMFVSIHANASTNTNVNGTETWCHGGKTSNKEEGCLLAKKINEQIAHMTGLNDRGVKVSELGTWNDFYVIRNTFAPSVLVELAFLSNSGDAETLLSDYYRDIYAKAIVKGIENYYASPIE